MNYKLKLLITTIFIIISCSSVLDAQSKYYKHEYSIEAGIGMSGLKYKTSIGKKTNNLGGQIGVGYTYFAKPSFGIHTGVNFALYNSTMKIGELSNKYNTIDSEGVEFEFRSKILDYKENQYALYATIPLMLQYHQNIGKYKLYIGAGGKFGIPAWTRAKSKGTLRNTGYYNEFEPEYDSQEFLGFGTFKGQKSNNSMDLKVAYIAAFELGMKWNLKDNQSIYTSAYLDYGLNNVQKDSRSKDFIKYNSVSPRDFEMNSIMRSQYTQDKQVKEFTNKVKPIAVGLKVRFSFGKKAVYRKAPEHVTPDVVIVPDSTIIVHKKIEVEDKSSAIDSIPDKIEAAVPVVKEITQETEDKLKKKFASDDIDESGKDHISIFTINREEEINKIVKDSIEHNIIRKTTVIEDVEYRKAKNIWAKNVNGYAIGSTKLTLAMKKDLDQMIVELKELPGANITLEGNTCNIGGSAINRRIAWERAEEVRTYMIKQGIDEERITVVSSGKLDPEKTNQNTEENRRKNRRVEIFVSSVN